MGHHLKMNYYLIHGLDRKRAIFMRAQFRHFGIDPKNVFWINHPNQDENLPNNICTNKNLTKGQIAITYKHYLALEDIVRNKKQISVVMEDNIEFLDNVPKRLNLYLNQLPMNWDLLGDSDFLGFKYLEADTNADTLVYLKSNSISEQCHGATKGCHFYMITYMAATKLLESFLPFHEVSDHYFNFLIRKYRLNVYWAEPTNVHKVMRKSTWL